MLRALASRDAKKENLFYILKHHWLSLQFLVLDTF